MRVAIANIWHEALTFSPLETELKDFQEDYLCFGHEIVETFRGTDSGVAGFVDAVHSEGAELVPIMAAGAWPSGRLTAETYDFLKGKLLTGIDEAGELDGVLLALHGCMVAEGLDNADGDLLAAVRGLIGEQLPLVATLGPAC